MKQYQTQSFTKNGVTVNAVYIVKSGDTLSGIRKTVKRLGGKTADLEKIDASVVHGLAPGQFVYFNSSLPRADESSKKVLNNHELERCPYQVLTLTKLNFKATLDDYVGYPNAWIEVLALNRFKMSDFVTNTSVQVKVYHAKKSFAETNTVKGQVQKNFLDQQLALVNEKTTEANLVIAERAPASEEPHKAGGGLVTLGFIVLIVMFVLAYRASKKSIALDDAG